MINTDSDRSTRMILSLPDRGISELRDITSFSYVSDCMALANPFSAEVRDPDSHWSSRIRRGDRIDVYLSNPDVNQGQYTRKLTGRIKDMEQDNRAGTGRVLRITGADLGHHLIKDFGPLGFALSRTTYEQLMKAVIHPSWGFAGVRWGDSNGLNRQIKLGRKQKLLQITATGHPPLQYIGIEPGETVSAVLLEVAKFDGKLLNVSADGYLQAWNPNYNREPAYMFHYYAADESARSRNNMQSVRVASTSDGIFSRYTCCGEVLIQLQSEINTKDPHPGRKIGRADLVLNSQNAVEVRAGQRQRKLSAGDKEILPYFSQKNYVDTEQFDSKRAQVNAEWSAQQALFAAWSYEWESPYHQQNGVWFESDQMTSLCDYVNYDDTYDPPKRIVGNYWIYRVELHWDKDHGGGTKFKAGKPGLLSAPAVGLGGLTKYDREILRKSREQPTT
jgi:prophage tail gpP-like protein